MRDLHKCQRCGREEREDSQTLRLQGWRIWSGTTVGGANQTVLFCSVCTGQATTDLAAAEPVGFTAGCHTCMEDMDADWLGKPVAEATRKDAEEWTEDHRCEPDTFVSEPKPRRAVA